MLSFEKIPGRISSLVVAYSDWTATMGCTVQCNHLGRASQKGPQSQ